MPRAGFYWQVVNPQFACFTSMQVQMLTQPAVCHVPVYIGSLVQLRVLLLSRNRIEALPETLGELTSRLLAVLIQKYKY